MSKEQEPPNDPFARLRSHTSARIGLGRCGQSLPTRPMLDFQYAHACARDAVHAVLDIEHLRAAIEGKVVAVRSQAQSRADYLRAPHRGRRLDPADREKLVRGDHDLAIVVGDGLSATAAHAHAPALIKMLRPRLQDLSIAPVILAHQARVALGDEIGKALGARMVLMLIGERPGLSAADSLGAYLTWNPDLARRDSERNCVSNIRSPGGFDLDQAAATIAWLIRAAARLGLTGTGLKDRSGGLLADSGLSDPKVPALDSRDVEGGGD